MPMLDEGIPGYLTLSLFLFFVGLGDSLFNINTTVGISTMVPIGMCGTLYGLTDILSLIFPQSPYTNPFSSSMWFMFQILGVRRYRDQGPDGRLKLKSVDTDMMQGQMQLAIEETDARKDRDVRAIRWLIHNTTEDAEVEKLVSAIPGSFNTDWGVDVWNEVGKRKKTKSVDRGRDQSAQVAGPPVGTRYECFDCPSHTG